MTKRLLSAALLLLASVCAYADGGCVHDVALQKRSAGLTVIAGASVRVCTDASCNSLATIYTDSALGTTTTNPVIADTNGNYNWCAVSGTYTEKVSNLVDGTSYFKHNVTAQGTTAASATKSAVQDKGFVNAVSDCGVPSDRTSDSCSAMTACLTANQGKRIGFPKLGTPSQQDYYSSCRWDLHGNGTSIFGMGGPGRWGGSAVRVQFASGTAGIRMDTDCAGCALENLEPYGADPFNRLDLKTYEDFDAEADFQGNSGIDGVQVLGESPVIKNVQPYGWKRHCFLINGNSGGQPDLGQYFGLVPNACRAYGVYTYGTDANVSAFYGLNAWFNALGGVKDSAFYGNSWYTPHSSGNAGFAAVAAGANKTIAAANGLVVATNVLTITTTTAHGWVVNDWITTTGSTDTGFNGTCKLTSVPTTTTAVCPFTHADGNTANGTGKTSASTDVSAYYTAKGIKFGSYVSTSTAGASTWYAPYTESDAGTPVWGGSVVFSPQGVTNYTTGSHFSGDSNSNAYIKAHGVVFTPNAASGEFFQITDTTGGTNEFFVDMNTGATTMLGRLKVGVNPATTGMLGLPNGSANALMFRNNANGANLFGVYMDTSDQLNLGDAAGVISQKLKIGTTSGTFITDSRPIAQYSATLTTTAAASDNVAMTGVTASSKCSLTATNASAATNIATSYISAKSANQVTVTHTATASMTYDILCTQN